MTRCNIRSNAQSVSTALCSRGSGRACLRRACSFASSARACRAWANSSCIAASSMRAARSSFLCGAIHSLSACLGVLAATTCLPRRGMQGGVVADGKCKVQHVEVLLRAKCWLVPQSDLCNARRQQTWVTMVASISFAHASNCPSRVFARPLTTTTAPGAPSQLSMTCPPHGPLCEPTPNDVHALQRTSSAHMLRRQVLLSLRCFLSLLPM